MLLGCATAFVALARTFTERQSVREFVILGLYPVTRYTLSQSERQYARAL
jgi:hypothetical protein